MPTYAKAPSSVAQMANEILCEFHSHQPILDCRVKIDFVFAYGEADETGRIRTPALSKGGLPCHGLTRVLSLKDRAMGRGDVEVSLDADYWDSINEMEKRAILDHELHHIVPQTTRAGSPVTDDLSRPKIKLRKHDFEFGWFKVIAERHGDFSVERQQAKILVTNGGKEIFGQLHLPLV